MVIEAVSHSKFWPQTAIFVVEDDAQNGPDHVDAHRTTAFVISPYTRRGDVDSTLYSTSSMLRTMELILGLKPMSQFDAAAAPCSMPSRRSLTLGPIIETCERRPRCTSTAGTPGVADLKMNFAREDAADDLLLNESFGAPYRGRTPHACAGPRRVCVPSSREGWRRLIAKTRVSRGFLPISSKKPPHLSFR